MFSRKSVTRTAADAGGEFCQHGHEQVVGHGPRKLRVLQFEQNGSGLGLTDPDGEKTVLVLDSQQDDGLLAGDVEADSVDDDSLGSLPFLSSG